MSLDFIKLNFRYKMSTTQNPPSTNTEEFLFQLQMCWYDLGEDGQKWVVKHLGNLTDIMKVKPRDDLIAALVTFWDPVHNVFHSLISSLLLY